MFRNSRLALACVLSTALGLAGLTGCSAEEVDDASSAEDAVRASTSAPQKLDDLSKLKSKELLSLFNGEEAKRATHAHGPLAGNYEGIALCRKDILPKKLPTNVAAIHGASRVFGLLGVSDGASNRLADQIWHGKQFVAPKPGAERGSVKNFIDVTDRKIKCDAAGGTSTRTAAEAEHFIDTDQDRDWLVLDYKGASDSIRGLRFAQDISTELIQHVYDTARIVNEKEELWLGMAWLVNTPGEYVDGDTTQTVPSCFFALQRAKDQCDAKGE